MTSPFDNEKIKHGSICKDIVKRISRLKVNGVAFFENEYISNVSTFKTIVSKYRKSSGKVLVTRTRKDGIYVKRFESDNSVKEFKEEAVSKKSISNRKLVCGVGINDADYITSKKTESCPFYKRWLCMISRCYSESFSKLRPTYNDVTVCKEWLTFSNFKKWMIVQDWEGKELDKDIIKRGNKIYSPDNCVFVDSDINKLLNQHLAKKGDFKIGVAFHKKANKFVSQCKNGKNINVNLGLFKTEDEAHEAYIDFKSSVLMEVAEQQKDIRIKNGLIGHAQSLQNSIA